MRLPWVGGSLVGNTRICFSGNGNRTRYEAAWCATQLERC